MAALRSFRALVVDFGGVLTTNIWSSFAEFCQREGIEPDRVRQLFRDDPDALGLLRSLERGEIDESEFEPRFGAMLGVADTDALTARLFAGLGPDETMLAAIRGASSAGLKTGLISNSWGLGIYDRAPVDLFDATVISGDVGLHKPEPEIYLLACERLGVDAAECVFVDDLRENVAGAEAVGMTGVLHRDSARTVTELERLLGLELAGAEGAPRADAPRTT